MRYIGSKERLLTQIENLLTEKAPESKGGIFCDIFAGTGVVGNHFKDRYTVVSNDYLFFSYLLNFVSIQLNQAPSFAKLKKIGVDDPFAFLESRPIPAHVSNGFFFAKAYSPFGKEGRMYLTEENAKRVDFIRSQIDDWKRARLLSNKEELYLIASLVAAIPSVSNVTGTYGAFLKFWDKRCLKPISLERVIPLNNHRNNKVFNEDSNELIGKIRGDVLYIDPPYNARDYLSNYHLLETIAKNDLPEVKGVTGVRQDRRAKSSYCSKKQCKASFDSLIAQARFRHIIVSYNSEGILSEDDILEILKKYCIPSTVTVKRIEFARYQSKKTNNSSVFEYLFYGQKNVNCGRGRKIAPSSQKMVSLKRFVKSPMNYTGGKYRILPQLEPLFPKDITTLVDLFAGGFNISVNIPAQQVIGNDINTLVVEMIRKMVEDPIEATLKRIHAKIDEYQLSKTNEEGFKRFRDFYNKVHYPIDLFTLSCFSFNYQFRFNGSGEYNNPFGRNRSSYSMETEKKLIAFITKMRTVNISFLSKDFRKIPLDGLDNRSFIYCDPPYLLTTGSYNDGKRLFGDWLPQDEADLLAYLDEANRRGIRFALSEITRRNGVENTLLLEWGKKYKINLVNCDYSNCNYHLVGGENYTEEVLITNY